MSSGVAFAPVTGSSPVELPSAFKACTCGHLVVRQGGLDQIPQSVRFRGAVLVGDFGVGVLEAVIELGIDTLKVESS